MNNTDDTAFLHTFTILILGLTAVGIFAFILAGFVADRAESGQPTKAIVFERTEPTGKFNDSSEVVVIGTISSPNPSNEYATVTPSSTESAASPSEKETGGIKTGKDVYNQACSLCHMAGVAGAPRYADKGAWGSRISKGIELLYSNAINGYVGSAGVMPAKGGRPDLKNDEVKSAVDYILSSVN